jgi:uncharacterized protein (TIGR03083 family)
MESGRLLTCLGADFDRLRSVVAEGDLTATVPSCPGWTVTDLVRHVAVVYLHKVECMRTGRFPDSWPPDLDAEESVPLLDRAYAALTAEFAARKPTDPAATFVDSDRTVGFWIRRMAQETAIHRVDAELALGQPVAPIPDDLAVDGVDEILLIFVGYGSRRWPEEFEPALKDATGRAVRLSTVGHSWLVSASRTGIDVRSGADGGAAQVAASIDGEPAALLRWLWARGGEESLRFDGDGDAVTELRSILAPATQ